MPYLTTAGSSMPVVVIGPRRLMAKRQLVVNRQNPASPPAIAGPRSGGNRRPEGGVHKGRQVPCCTIAVMSCV